MSSCRWADFAACDDLLLLEVPEELDVVDHRALQEHRFLGHERHRVVRIALGDRRRVHAADRGLTARGLA